jgi:hypothetical protein
MKRNVLCIVSSRHDEARKEMQRTSRRKRKETTRRYMAAHSCFRLHAYVSEASSTSWGRVGSHRYTSGACFFWLVW